MTNIINFLKEWEYVIKSVTIILITIVAFFGLKESIRRMVLEITYVIQDALMYPSKSKTREDREKAMDRLRHIVKSITPKVIDVMIFAIVEVTCLASLAVFFIL